MIEDVDQRYGESDHTPARNPFHILLIVMMLASPLSVALNIASAEQTQVEVTEPWWEFTTMDMDGNYLHDALDIALHRGDYITDGRISVLVDFDHTPTEGDQEMLVHEVEFSVNFRFHSIDIISGSVPIDRMDDLLALPGVVFISLNGEMRVLMDSVVPEHHVDTVWDQGYTGEGMTVAVIDTGIDAEHVGLNDFDDDPTTYDPKVIAFYDAVNTPDETDGSTTPQDHHGHGSHCSGIAAGTGEEDPTELDGQENNKYVGVAPGANLVGVKVLDDGGSGTFDQVMAGMQWCIDHREEFNIRAATMSLGGFGYIELTQSEEERVSTLANKMVAEGIALTIAAGNSFTYGSIGTPGNARDVITVGATEKSRNTAAYSSRGPTAEGLVKPNVAAIGSSVMSVDADTKNGYTSMSGTSMATPVVAGIMCLILEANPDLDPLTLRSILQYTAEFRWVTHPVRPNNDYGWGFVEADAALEEAVEIDASLNITIDPETPIRLYVGNETEGNQERYLGYMGEEIRFLVEGNTTGLEWRPVEGDSWIRVNQIEPDVIDLPLHEHSILPGTHYLWVRAFSDEGVSAPQYIILEIEPARDDEEGDDGINMMYIGFPIIIVIVLIAAWMTIRNRKEGHADDGDEDDEDYNVVETSENADDDVDDEHSEDTDETVW